MCDFRTVWTTNYQSLLAQRPSKLKSTITHAHTHKETVGLITLFTAIIECKSDMMINGGIQFAPPSQFGSIMSVTVNKN